MNKKKVKTDNLYVCLGLVEFYDDYGEVYNCLHIPKIYEKTGDFLELDDNLYESFYDIETDDIKHVLDDTNVYINSDEESMHLEDFIKLSTLLEEFDNISSNYQDITETCFKGYASLLKKKISQDFIERDKIYALSKIIFTIHNYVYEFRHILDDDFTLYETEVIDFNKYKRSK